MLADTKRPDSRIPLWLLPNVLSLDAPLVAISWQALLAAHTHIPMLPVGRAVLGLTVWAIYIGDRLLDVRNEAQPPTTARHQFYKRHRRFSLGLLICVMLTNLSWIVYDLRLAVLVNGLIALLAVLLYLAVVHRLQPLLRGSIQQPPILLPKEALVAALFTVGTFIVAWSRSQHPLQDLWRPAVSFFLLCLLNLTLIEAWEWRARSQDAPPPHWTTANVIRAFPAWVLSVILFCWWNGGLFGNNFWNQAIALSAGGLGLLFAVGDRLPPEVRRVLADAALLTPLLFLFRN